LCTSVISFGFAPKIPPDHFPLILARVLIKKWLELPPLARVSMSNPTNVQSLLLPAKIIHNIWFGIKRERETMRMARVFALFHRNCTLHYLSTVNQLVGGLFFAGDNSRLKVVEHHQRYKMAAGNTRKPIKSQAMMSGPSLLL
jgi:hypothetical protein